MLSPKALNVLPGSSGNPQLPLSWYGPGRDPICPPNIRAAFGGDERETILPIALMPQHVHPRVTAQKSCFIVYGKQKEPLEKLLADIKLTDNDLTEGHFSEVGVAGKNFSDVYLKKYQISPRKRDSLLRDLMLLGISYATLFPDLDGLSRELSSNL
jgi:hypothetical protein